MPNPVVHFDIGCRNREKTNEFYTKLFGWKTTDYGPLSKAVDTASDNGINGYLTALGHEPHNYVMVYIEVEDIAATLEECWGLRWGNSHPRNRDSRRRPLCMVQGY